MTTNPPTPPPSFDWRGAYRRVTQAIARFLRVLVGDGESPVDDLRAAFGHLEALVPVEAGEPAPTVRSRAGPADLVRRGPRRGLHAARRRSRGRRGRSRRPSPRASGARRGVASRRIPACRRRSRHARARAARSGNARCRGSRRGRGSAGAAARDRPARARSPRPRSPHPPSVTSRAPGRLPPETSGATITR